MASRRKAPSRLARKPRTTLTPGPAGVRAQLAATVQILRALANEPGNLQPVLDAVAEHAARVCGATDSVIHRLDGDLLRLMAHHGPIPLVTKPGDTILLTRQSTAGRAVLEQRTIHLPDLEAAAAEFPTTFRLSPRAGRCSSRAPRKRGAGARRDRHPPLGGAPVHPRADRRPRELRRPGGHRHRERAAVLQRGHRGPSWSSRRRRARC